MTIRPLALIVSITLCSCGAKNKEAEIKAPPPATVSIEQVEKQKAIYYDEYPATVTALNQVDLRAQVTGYVTAIFFKDGQLVHQGQRLYDIDRQQYQANLDQAIANLNVSKANLAKAQQDADRYADLLRQDAIAKQVYDHAMDDLQGAEMQVQAAQSSVRNVETSVKYSFINAPFTGTIGISLVKRGTLVTANQTLLNTISSDDPMAVDVQVNQKEIARFSQLQKNSLTRDSIFTLRLPDNSLYGQTGKVYLIDRAVDPQTGTIKTRLTFPNAENALKVGMDVSVRVKNNNADSLSLIIPYKAVTEQMGEYFVYVVDDSSRAFQRKITLGTRMSDKVIVRDGLSEGEKVVTEGFQKLKDSTKVRITPPASNPQPAGNKQP